AGDIEKADCILVMSCAFGVQTVGLYTDKAVYPALNTLFLGKETSPGNFTEVCLQCGQCVLGQYAGVCPMTQCAKSLLNGPCGGTKNGKCEHEPEYDCAWVLIYDRLNKLGRINEMKEYVAPTDYRKMSKQRHIEVAPLD
ncbi:methylenetetrahydrofolate reductase C-terminal domain-containing protein, partial [Chloroflexota bacterium]